MCETTKSSIVRGALDWRRFGEAVAVVSMPQLSSSYAFLALSFSIGGQNRLLILTISVVFASLIEAISLLTYAQVSRKNLNVEDREDRPALFLVAILSYFIGFAVLRYLDAPFIFSALMFAYVVNTVMAAVITKFLTKVSIHTWGITGPSVAIMYSFGVLAFMLALVAGAVVGGTRIRMGYHTRGQVVLSFLVSIPLTWIIIYILPLVLPTLFAGTKLA